MVSDIVLVSDIYIPFYTAFLEVAHFFYTIFIINIFCYTNTNKIKWVTSLVSSLSLRLNIFSALRDFVRAAASYDNGFFSYLIFKYINNKLQKYVIINLFTSYLYPYIYYFFSIFNIDKSNSLIDRIDNGLSSLFIKIKKDMSFSNFLFFSSLAQLRLRYTNIFFFLAFFTYMYLSDINIIYLYIAFFFFSIASSIELINLIEKWINYNEFEDNYPFIYKIVKIFLFVLLFMDILILIFLGQKIWMLLKVYILNKLKDLKLNLDYLRLKNNNTNKPGPNKPSHFFPLSSNKKEDKKKAHELKQELLEVQKNFVNKSSNKFNVNSSLSQNRNWTNTIELPETSEFTVENQIKNLDHEFKQYDNQEKTFKTIVVNISKKKEKFYPDESRVLFNEYVKLVNILKKNLKSTKKELRKYKNKK